ncbi:hypothetical protein, partial [uncultured Rikenella sp.]|uniref:hypothetical protein n=1 Tax=uncultured Rikenella sp. TaxID=368003 RepID=UPI00260A9455
LYEPQKHCPVYASLRLRFRSAAAVARWDFILILLTAKRVKSLLKRAGAPIGRFTGRLYPRSLSARWRKSYSNANHAFE